MDDHVSHGLPSSQEQRATDLPNTDIQALYNEFYYRHCTGEAYNEYERYQPLFEHIAESIIREIEPKTVLDVGCALGYLVRTLRERSVDAYGIDVSEYAITSADPAIRPYLHVASATEALIGRYDLITCFEVVEHMRPQDAVVAIRNMTAATDDILFSSSPLDYSEVTHVNVRPLEYWATVFAEFGFYRDIEFDATFSFPWAVRFRRRGVPPHRVVGDYERKMWELQQSAEGQRAQAMRFRKDIENLQAHISELERMLKEYPTHVKLVEQERDAALAYLLEVSKLLDPEVDVDQLRLSHTRLTDQEVAALGRELVSKLEAMRKDSQQRFDRPEQQYANAIAEANEFYMRSTQAEQEVIAWQQRALEAEATLQALRNTRAVRMVTPYWQLKNRLGGKARQERPSRIRRARFLGGAAIKTLRQEGPPGFTRKVGRWMKGQRTSIGMYVGSGGLPDIPARYKYWISKHEPTALQLEEQRIIAQSLTYRPLISIIVPVCDPPLDVLRQMLRSVTGQTYENWQLCIANAGKDKKCAAVLDDMAKSDPRVRLIHLPVNGGISENSNQCLALAQGEFIGLLDHDDTLAPHALFAVVSALNQSQDLDIIYSDEDKITEKGERFDPFMKPDWSPELLHSFMYIGHLTVYRRDIISQLGGFRRDFDGSQDYDLILRASEVTDRIHHIPQVLYHWRVIATSASSGAKPYARRTNLNALAEAMTRRGHRGQVVEYPYSNRFRFAISSTPLVSIIIPTDDLNNSSTCVTHLFANTKYPNIEVVVVTNSRVATELEHQFADKPVRCIRFDQPFNFSLKCNVGAKAASGDYLLFLNDDVEPVSDDWIESLLEYAQQPEIGGVSPKLLYTDNSIQYAGMVTNVRELVGTAFHKWDRMAHQYSNMAVSIRNVSGLSGACMLVRQSTFWEIGGWDAENAAIANSDFDISFKLRERGLRLVYTPFAEMRHIGHHSIGKVEEKPRHDNIAAYDVSHLYMLERWGTYMSYDPYFPENMRTIVYHDGRDTGVYARTGEFSRDIRMLRRVLLISHDLTLSGAPMILLEIARHLKSQGFWVTVCAPEAGPLLAEYEALRIPVIVNPYVLEEPRSIAYLFGAFNLIVANTVLSWRSVNVARQAGVAAVWLIHESQFGVDYLQHEPGAAKDAFINAASVVFPSAETVRTYQRYLARSTYYALPYGLADVGLDQDMGAPFTRDERKIYLVHVGTLERRKGADILVRAMEQLPESISSRVEAHFVGRYHEPEYVQQIQRMVAGKPNMHIVGQVPRPTVLGYMRHSDVFVCTSHEETGPIVVMEAMGLSRAVISTRVGAAGEIIQSGMNGILIGINDVDRLADAITEFVMHPERINQLGQAARETFVQKLTLDRYGSDLINIFTSAIERRPAPDIEALSSVAQATFRR